ncbi:MAG: fatty acid desaturase, partial [Planctomycetota bacterium]
MQTSSPRLSESRAAELHQHNTASAKRAIAFVTIYALSAVGAVSLAASLESAWKYLACLPLYLLSAASLHGISLFTHEGVHGALSKNVHWNRWLSMVCALPVLQNFSAYRVLHLKHHRHLGDEGDPDHYKNYSRWTWVVFAMHWGRLLIGYPAYLIMIPILGFRQGTRSERHWILLEIGLLIATVALLVWVAPPFRVVLHAWLLPMLLINTMVNIRGMSQHTLLEHETDPVKGTRTICTHPIVAYLALQDQAAGGEPRPETRAAGTSAPSHRHAD